MTLFALEGELRNFQWKPPSRPPLPTLRVASGRTSRRDAVTGSFARPAQDEDEQERFVRLLEKRLNWTLKATYEDPELRSPDFDLLFKALRFLVRVAPRHPRFVPFIVPLCDGGVQVEWHLRPVDIEATFAPDEDPCVLIKAEDGAVIYDDVLAGDGEKLVRKELIAARDE